MKNITFSVEQAMTVHVPMCVVCGNREVQIVVNSVGSGYCSTRCEEIAGLDRENDCGRCSENGDYCSQENVRYSEFWESTECQAWRDDSPNSGRFSDTEREDSHDVWAEMQSDRFETWRNEY